MSAHARNSILKGIIAGGICWLLLSPLVVRIFGIPAAASTEIGAMLSHAAPILLFVCLLCMLAGVTLGTLGGFIEQKRRLKMALAGLGVYWLDALLVSIWLIFFSNDSPPPDYTIWNRIWGAFMLSLVGSLLYGIVLIPIVLIASLLLEKWTRKVDP